MKKNIKQTQDTILSAYILIGRLQAIKEFAIANDSDLIDRIDFLKEKVNDIIDDNKPCREVIIYLSKWIDEIQLELINEM